MSTPLSKEQLSALQMIVNDLRTEAVFIAPVELADPAEISNRDRVKAEALNEYADKLEGHIKKWRYEARQGGAAA
ncbi:hypothetical protein [Saccharopolyspora sp. NPDC002376]